VPRSVLVVQNDPDKSAGAIGDALVEAGVALDVRSPDRDLPSAADYAGLLVLPGLADPVDEVPPVHRARAVIHEALEAELPVLGLCLGGQLLVQELGGTVYRSRPELGFGEVYAAAQAANDPLLAAVPDHFSVFHAHAFAFEPPSGANILLTNDVCVQACRYRETWAFQCHPEVSREWAEALARGIRGDPGGLPEATAAFFRRNGITPEELERDARSAEPVVRQVARSIGAGFAARIRDRVPDARPRA
jgi:GMP synthase-like glutamine amidotransferase